MFFTFAAWRAAVFLCLGNVEIIVAVMEDVCKQVKSKNNSILRRVLWQTSIIKQNQSSSL